MTSSSSARPPTTLYDVLGVAAEATTEEIKKRYRALAIRYHPDKLGLLADGEASAAVNAHFAAITEAYKVLSDDRQRRWYDAHAVERLSAAEIEESHLDEAYFTSACFSGFEEDGKWSLRSFYTVYGSLFERIVELEQRFNEDFDYPSFGGSGAELTEVKRFYDVWQSFSTGFTFSHLEGLFDTRSAMASGNTSRQVLRLAKKENAKLVEKARKERNGRVRRLVALLRKVDPRMRLYQRQLEAKAAENRLKSEQHRLRQLAEARKALDEWQSASGKQQQQQQTGGWLDMSAIEEELEKLDNGDEDEEDEEVDEEDEEEDEEEEEVYFCADCNRLFKTENTLRSHQKSKKHLAVVKQRQKQKKEVDDDDEDEVEDEEDE